MTSHDPHDVSQLDALDEFLGNHPPFGYDDFVQTDNFDDEYAAALRAVFPDSSNSIVSLTEEMVIRRKVTILGCELISFHPEVWSDYVEGRGHVDGYDGPFPTVRLPDGSAFVVRGADC